MGVFPIDPPVILAAASQFPINSTSRAAEVVRRHARMVNEPWEFMAAEILATRLARANSAAAAEPLIKEFRLWARARGLVADAPASSSPTDLQEKRHGLGSSG